MAALKEEKQISELERRNTQFQKFPKLKEIVDQWTECADCNQKDPKWAEISRGILVCLQCSGCHRHLGTDVSKIRSIALDSWTQAMVDKMYQSNEEFNKIWEYHVDASFMKPTSKTKRDLRTKYIEAKYRDSKFQEKLSNKRLDPVFASSDFDELEDGKKNVGQGMVKYTGVIQFHSMSARHLPKGDLLTGSDPYVVFSNKNGQSVQTKTINNCTNPIWNEHLMLSVNENEPINITIYDQDFGTADDLLCSMTLDIGSKCKEGEEVILKDLPMKVEKSFAKQNKKSTFSFAVLYNKMNAE